MNIAIQATNNAQSAACTDELDPGPALTVR
jgi:hypothetical protein